MFIAALATITKLWREPKYLSTDDRKEWNLAICNEVDGAGVYYAKRVSQSERQIPYDLTHNGI